MKQIRFAFLAIPLALSACLKPNGPTTSLKGTASNSSLSNSILTPASGPRAAKFIFKQSSTDGSFDSAPAGGTAPTPGSGLQAKRVFNADGSLLASGGVTASAWPKWLPAFEIGISGSSNTKARNPDCARFASAGESSTPTCDFGGGPNSANCAAASGLFRVSEYDCGSDLIIPGNGGPDDGIYIRAFFSRNSAYLNSGENIMAVLEYAASSLYPAPANPTSCFTNGSFSPEACSDLTWKMYLKHSSGEIVQPFLLFVPPTFASVNAVMQTGGSGITSKQFFLPLAGDTGLSVFQLSRIRANPAFENVSDPVFRTRCSVGGNGGTPANSPLCVGMVFYSITFYRI